MKHTYTTSDGHNFRLKRTAKKHAKVLKHKGRSARISKRTRHAKTR
jgi:hypothetical protein